MTYANSGRPLTQLEIDRIAKVYVQTLSKAATARRTGYSFQTITKYVEEGDPLRNIPPIRDVMRRQIEENATKQLSYSVGRAFDESTSVIKIIKSLYGYKVKAMLDEYTEALKSGDQSIIDAARKKIDPHLRLSDLPKLLVAESILFDKMAPKDIRDQKDTDAKGDATEEDLSEILAELSAAGLVADGDEVRESERSEDPETEEEAP